MNITVTIGPVPASSAACWLRSAKETLETIRVEPPVDVPWDVLDAFVHYLTEWTEHLADDAETFMWSAEVDDAVVRRIGLHWARLVSVVRSGRRSGLSAAPPEAKPFYEAIANGIAEGLAAGGDDVLAGAFSDAVPDFDARRPDGAFGVRRVRVLIVDREEEVRLLLRVWLEGDSGFEVAGEATDGHQAIALARATQPDVAVLDLETCGLHGLTLIQSAAPACAVVVRSAGEERVAALAAGAAAFVPRSRPVDEVLALIRGVAVAAQAG